MDIDFILRYMLVPLFSAVLAGLWYMIKQQNIKIDSIELRTNTVEKDIVEVRTALHKDIQYIAEDIKEIKEILKTKNR